MIVVRVAGIAIAGVSLAVLSSSASSPPTSRPPASNPHAGPRPVAPAPVSPAWAPVPGREPAADSALIDLSATGPHDVWAIGHQKAAENNDGATVLLRWDGRRWRAAPRPPAARGYMGPFATAIAAARPNDVWMVGSDAPGSSSAFASHWDGRRWTDRRLLGGQRDSILRDTTATGGKAWFVGSGPKGGIIVEWDGHAFRRVQSGIGCAYSALNSVSVKDGELWAVGSVGDSDAPKAPLIYHQALDGDSAPQETPDIPLGELTGIWQISPSDVWAVGVVHCHGESCDRPLVLHWDGSTWSRSNAPIRRGALYGVTAIAEDDVWLSGIDLDHERQVLFLHYDGKAWTRQYGPPLRTGGSAEEGDDQVNRPSITPVRILCGRSDRPARERMTAIRRGTSCSGTKVPDRGKPS